MKLKINQKEQGPVLTGLLTSVTFYNVVRVFLLNLNSCIFFNGIGGVGVMNMIHKLQNHEYMGFENFCHR